MTGTLVVAPWCMTDYNQDYLLQSTQSPLYFVNIPQVNNCVYTPQFTVIYYVKIYHTALCHIALANRPKGEDLLSIRLYSLFKKNPPGDRISKDASPGLEPAPFGS